MMRVAIQGEPGAYSELAVREHFGTDYELVPCRTLADVRACLLDRQCDAAVVPLENSIAGVVPGAEEIVRAPEVTQVAAFWLPIHHCLLALPGASLDGLRTVLSHPMALAQCQAFFRRHPQLNAREWYDTAGAALRVAQLADGTVGAIASEVAAERYGLRVLGKGVEDRPDNRTRFAVLRTSFSFLPFG